jgi:hypothetical protein
MALHQAQLFRNSFGIGLRLGAFANTCSTSSAGAHMSRLPKQLADRRDREDPHDKDCLEARLDHLESESGPAVGQWQINRYTETQPERSSPHSAWRRSVRLV